MTGQVARTIGIPALGTIAALYAGPAGTRLALTAAVIITLTGALLVARGLQHRRTC